ncbi:MAG: zinc-dependent alcohol dehydrogenase family protein [Gammaproteobacteria bacterium]
MRAMVLRQPGQALVMERRDDPQPGPGQVLLRVLACAVCRTDLHLVDGELPDIPLPVIPGHEIVGEVIATGSDVHWKPGQRLGVPWLGFACGHCGFCDEHRENLCDQARFTGYQLDGGFADRVIADQRFCFQLDPAYGDVEAAPLLCAGLIGYRALTMAGEGSELGIYGFGAAAHIVAQVAVWQGRRVYAFTRPGDTQAQTFARELGAHWAGDSDQSAPVLLDAAIIFAPVGDLVPKALAAVRKGGIVVCGGIHMSDIPSFPYRLMWGERVLRSVANLTRRDALDFLEMAPKIPIRTRTVTYPLERANEALADLRHGRLSGAAVLIMEQDHSGVS